MSLIPLQKSQPHPRRFIRNKVKELLRTNTDLAGKWYCTRSNTIFPQELPCGLIYFPDEEVEESNTTPVTYKRKLTLITEVQHRSETNVENDVDDFLDSRAFEIEAILMYDRYLELGDLDFIESVKLSRTQCTTIKNDGDSDIACIRLFWEITYLTDSWTEIALEEFLRFESEYNLQVGDGATAKDSVIIREE